MNEKVIKHKAICDELNQLYAIMTILEMGGGETDVG